MLKKRSYEVSIWTLQDDFIGILKAFNLENKGQLFEPEMVLKDDGTEEFSFSIPMYIYDGDKKIDNPLWYNVTNGNLVEDLRKIKVTFNKGEPAQKTFEFVILDITERHENDELICDVKCEGLAFHELGKIGYKIELSGDVFNNEYYEWFDKGDETEEEPKATLLYWMNKYIMDPLPEDSSKINSKKWYYEINMNWDAFALTDDQKRETNKIYEEEYTGAWNVQDGLYIPSEVVAYKEKERLVDLKESNIYNLTQDLAKEFGVFCKYNYIHDENLHIIGKRVIFYNNYVEEHNGYVDLTYPYDAATITRNRDSKDVTTKMFILSVEDESTASGLISVINADANFSKEDYILNFDYLYKVGNITKEQYDEVHNYESNMRRLNELIEFYDGILEPLNNELIEVEAKITTTTNAIQLDKERIVSSEDLKNSITNQTGTINVTEDNPDSAAYRDDSERPGFYWVKLTNKGVLQLTIRVYLTYDLTTHKLTKEIKSSTPIKDEYGNVTGVTNLVKPQDSVMAFLTYSYTPILQYENVKKTWEARLFNDTAELETLENKKEILELLIQEYNDKREKLINQKNAIIEDFNHIMGPALRESYWQPEDYKNHGNNYLDTFNIQMNTNSLKGNTKYAEFIWDEIAFDSDQKGDYKIGVDELTCYYPAIDLSEWQDYIKTNIDKISFMFYDYDFKASGLEPTPKNIRTFSVPSTAQYGFVKMGTLIKPVLLLTDVKTMTQDSLKRMMTEQLKPLIGVLTATINIVNNETVIEVQIDAGAKQVVTNTNNYFINNSTDENGNIIFTEITVVYPRIKINSLDLLNTSDLLSLRYNDYSMINFEDYSVMPRDDSEWDDETELFITLAAANYITIKPKVIFGKTLFSGSSPSRLLKVDYNISNASTAIYLDAILIMKENSMPKVSYTIEPSAIRKDFSYDLYEKLRCICNINDYELKFDNVLGYISEITLNCDKPNEDKVEIKNYKTKFEDLFSTIVAQTQSMLKNEYTIGLASAAFNSLGELNEDIIQNTLRKYDLDYAFNLGALTIDEENGIWATSDSGVVAIRGGGIFTATEQDENGNWKWNTGIIPQGINADLITTGRLDTNLVNIYAGNKLRLQMNGDGLFAYKSIFDDPLVKEALAAENPTLIQTNILNEMFNLEQHSGLSADYLDKNQYVVHNENGLFLIANPGSVIAKTDGTVKNLNNEVQRVAISWNGLELRDWNNKKTFFADPDTGDLILEGTLYATGMYVGERPEDGEETPDTLEDYLRSLTLDDPSLAILDSLGVTLRYLNESPDHEIVTWFNTEDLYPIYPNMNTKLPNFIEERWGINWDDNGGYNNDNDDILIVNKHIYDVYYNYDLKKAWRFIITSKGYYWKEITDLNVLDKLEDSKNRKDFDRDYITTYYLKEKSITLIEPDDSESSIIPQLYDVWSNASRNNILYRYIDGKWIDAFTIIPTMIIQYGYSESEDEIPTEWTTEAPTWNSTQYIWTRTEVSKNLTSTTPPECIQRPSARLIYIDGNNQHFIPVNGDSIILTAHTVNLHVYQWYSIINGVETPIGIVGNDTLEITYANLENNNRVTYKVTTYEGQEYYDTYTIIKGDNSSVSPIYNAVLDKETEMIISNEYGMIEDGTVCEVLVYGYENNDTAPVKIISITGIEGEDIPYDTQYEYTDTEFRIIIGQEAPLKGQVNVNILVGQEDGDNYNCSVPFTYLLSRVSSLTPASYELLSSTPVLFKDRAKFVSAGWGELNKIGYEIDSENSYGAQAYDPEGGDPDSRSGRTVVINRDNTIFSMPKDIEKAHESEEDWVPNTITFSATMVNRNIDELAANGYFKITILRDSENLSSDLEETVYESSTSENSVTYRIGEMLDLIYIKCYFYSLDKIFLLDEKTIYVIDLTTDENAPYSDTESGLPEGEIGIEEPAFNLMSLRSGNNEEESSGEDVAEEGVEDDPTDEPADEPADEPKVIITPIESKKIILSNEYHAFSSDLNNEVNNSIECNVIEYDNERNSWSPKIEILENTIPNGMIIKIDPYNLSKFTVTIKDGIQFLDEQIITIKADSGIIYPSDEYKPLQLPTSKYLYFKCKTVPYGNSASKINVLYNLTPIGENGPLIPTDIVTTEDDVIEQWTTIVPTYKTLGVYYKCIQYISNSYDENFTNNIWRYYKHDLDIAIAMGPTESAISLAYGKTSVRYGLDNNKPNDSFNIGDLYITQDTGKEYIWTGTTWTPYNTRISGTALSVDAEHGRIELTAKDSDGNGGINIITNGSISINGNREVNIVSEGILRFIAATDDSINTSSIQILNASSPDTATNSITMDKTGLSIKSTSNIEMIGGSLKFIADEINDLTTHNGGGIMFGHNTVNGIIEDLTIGTDGTINATSITVDNLWSQNGWITNGYSETTNLLVCTEAAFNNNNRNLHNVLWIKIPDSASGGGGGVTGKAELKGGSTGTSMNSPFQVELSSGTAFSGSNIIGDIRIEFTLTNKSSSQILNKVKPKVYYGYKDNNDYIFADPIIYDGADIKLSGFDSHHYVLTRTNTSIDAAMTGNNAYIKIETGHYVRLDKAGLTITYTSTNLQVSGDSNDPVLITSTPVICEVKYIP